MKKFLSLVLALVMTMSLVTISAGAKDFTDDGEISYKEAVDVISALGVVDGYAGGTFQPTTTLTRGAAAKIICNMILGPTTAETLSADAAPFADVPANHVFAGYIAYCANQGIINGYGDGTFRPAGTLNGFAFMKMLLGALGYSSANEVYTGSNWTINVGKQAVGIGLHDGLKGDFLGNKDVTREEAALYAFNTLKATMVEYDNSIIITDGNLSTTSKAKEMEQGTYKSYTGASASDDKSLEFCERYFPNLKLDTTSDADDFARPANTWKIKSSKVGTYAKTPDLTYTEATKGKDVYSDLSKGAIADGDVTFFVDGVEKDLGESSELKTGFAIARNNDKKVGAQGALTEVFFNEDDETVVITVINTYLAQVSGDYDEDDEELNIDFEDSSSAPSVETTLSAEDFDNLEDFEDEDYVLVTIAFDGDDQYVYSIEAAEKATAAVTSYTKNDSVTAGGTKYKYNATYNEGKGPENYSVKDEYDLYLDAYGNVLFADGVEASDNYVYITEAAQDGNLSSSKIVVAAFFLDGTYQEISLDKVTKVDEDPVKASTLVNDDGSIDLDAGWYAYKEKSSGKYDLTEKVSATPTVADGEKVVDGIYVAGVRANASTKFVVADDLDADGDVYTGVKNAPTIKAAADKIPTVAIVMDGNYAKYVFISLNGATSKGSSTSSDLIFILDADPDESVDENDDTYYTYKAMVNGVEKKVNFNEDWADLDVGLYTDVVYDSDTEYVTDLELVVADADAFVDCEDFTVETYTDAKVTQKGSVVTIADSGDGVDEGDGYYLASGAKIFVIDGDDVKTVTAKKFASDYAADNGVADDPNTDEDETEAATNVLDAEVFGVINSDGEFTALYVVLA